MGNSVSNYLFGDGQEQDGGDDDEQQQERRMGAHKRGLSAGEAAAVAARKKKKHRTVSPTASTHDDDDDFDQFADADDDDDEVFVPPTGTTNHAQRQNQHPQLNAHHGSYSDDSSSSSSGSGDPAVAADEDDNRKLPATNSHHNDNKKKRSKKESKKTKKKNKKHKNKTKKTSNPLIFASSELLSEVPKPESENKKVMTTLPDVNFPNTTGTTPTTAAAVAATAVKRPKTSFAFYMENNHQRISTKYPHASIELVTRLAENEFHQLNENEKRIYDDMAKQDKTRYAIEMELAQEAAEHAEDPTKQYIYHEKRRARLADVPKSKPPLPLPPPPPLPQSTLSSPPAAAQRQQHRPSLDRAQLLPPQAEFQHPAHLANPVLSQPVEHMSDLDLHRRLVAQRQLEQAYHHHYQQRRQQLLLQQMELPMHSIPTLTPIGIPGYYPTAAAPVSFLQPTTAFLPTAGSAGVAAAGASAATPSSAAVIDLSRDDLASSMLPSHYQAVAPHARWSGISASNSEAATEGGIAPDIARSSPEDQPTTGKKKKKKDPNEPKRGTTSFVMYANATRPQLMKERPLLSLTDSTKILAERYKELPPQDKDKYVQLALEDKERYKREIAEYRRQKWNEVMYDRGIDVQNAIRSQEEEQKRRQQRYQQQLRHDNVRARQGQEVNKEYPLHSQLVAAQVHPPWQNPSEHTLPQKQQASPQRQDDGEYSLHSQHLAAHEQRFLEWQNRKRQQLSQKHDTTQPQLSSPRHPTMPTNSGLEDNNKTEEPKPTPPEHRLLLKNQPQQQQRLPESRQVQKDTETQAEPEATPDQPKSDDDVQEQETRESQAAERASFQTETGPNEETQVGPNTAAIQAEPEQDPIVQKRNLMEEMKELAC